MFETKNEALIGIANGIKEGRFKNCVHLKAVPSPWEPYCEEGCLNRGACPRECLLFVDKNALERAKRRAKQCEWIRATSRVPFRYFERLPATQALIVLVVVLVPLFYFSPRLAKSIIDVIKALK
jgi:hypothetical protein